MNRTSFRRIPGAAALAALALLLAACAQTGSAGPERATTAEDVEEADTSPYFEPDQLIGDEVTISGEVSEVVNERVFRIAGGGFDPAGLAVIAPSAQLQEGAVVQVTGTVAESDLQSLNDQLDQDLTDDLLAPIEDELAIAADQVDQLVPAAPGDEGLIGGDVTAIPQRLEAAGDFGSLLLALSTAQLTDVLQQAGPYTVFAPSDRAFISLPPNRAQELLAAPDQLGSILRYHVVEGEYTVDELRDVDTLTTLEGTTLDVGMGEDGEVTVDGAPIAETFEAPNGLVHAIPQILMP